MKHKLKSERAIIGGLLLYPDLYSRIYGSLKKSDFFDPHCQRAWVLIKDQHDVNGQFDAVSLMDAGMPTEWIGDVTSDAAHQDTIVFHSGLIRDYSSIRSLYRAFDQLRDLCTKGDKNASEIASAAQRAILESIRTQADIVDQSEMLEEYVKECRSRLVEPSSAASLGVSTGFTELDRLLVFEGIARGHVTTVGAQTSSGKSAFSQAIKRNASLEGASVLVCTLEDSKEANMRRDVSSYSGIENMNLQRNKVKPAEWSSFQGAIEKIKHSKGKVHYIDTYPDSIDELLSSCEQHYQANGLDLVIFDYLQLVPAGQQFQKRQQEIDFIFTRIIAWSKNHKDVAVLLVTQMARHEGQPRLDKLYHSASLEQGSHSVILIWNPKPKGWPKQDMGPVGKFERDCRIIDLAKQKDGPIGMTVLGWSGKTVSFHNASQRDMDDYMEALGMRRLS